jgi:methyl-accepting chemotaxis protein
LNVAAHDPANWKHPGAENPLIQVMDQYVEAYGIYKLALMVGTDGAVLAVNDKDARGKPIETGGVYRESFAGASWFAKAMNGEFLQGKNGFTGTVVEQPSISQVVAKAYPGEDGYSIIFAAPVHDQTGKIIGVWANFASFNLVEQIVGDFYRRLSTSGMPGAEITVLDPEGRVIVDWDPTRSDQQEGYRRNFAIIGKLNLVDGNVAAAKAAVGGVHGATLSMHARKHVWQASGYAPSAGAYDYPGLGWSVLVRVPSAQAFAEFNGVINEILIVLGLTLVAIALLGWFIGNGVSGPIKALNSVMGRLATGDTTVGIPGTVRHDEIGDMARAVEVFKQNSVERERLVAEQDAERALKEQRATRLDSLVRDFEDKVGGLVGLLASASTEMEATARSMSSTATETNQQASAVAAAAEEASAGVETVAAASEELAASVCEISRQVAHSARMTGKAVEDARRTDSIVRALADGAQRIGQVVELTTASPARPICSRSTQP